MKQITNTAAPIPEGKSTPLFLIKMLKIQLYKFFIHGITRPNHLHKVYILWFQDFFNLATKIFLHLRMSLHTYSTYCQQNRLLNAFHQSRLSDVGLYTLHLKSVSIGQYTNFLILTTRLNASNIYFGRTTTYQYYYDNAT